MSFLYVDSPGRPMARGWGKGLVATDRSVRLCPAASMGNTIVSPFFHQDPSMPFHAILTSLLAIAAATAQTVPAPAPGRCGTSCALGPGLGVDNPDCDYFQTNPSAWAPTSVLRIPVVVHVLQSTSGQGNLADALVQSQIFAWYPWDFDMRGWDFLVRHAPERIRAEIARRKITQASGVIPWDWSLNQRR